MRALGVLCAIAILGCFVALGAPAALRPSVKLESENLDHGAVQVTVTATTAGAFGVLLRVTAQSEADGSNVCDAYAPIAGTMDIRDAAVDPVAVGSKLLLKGVWSLTAGSGDPADRVYTATISPAHLRQHFADKQGKAAVSVAGGAIGATVQACLYERSTGKGISSTVFVNIVSFESATEGAHDMSATVVSASRASPTVAELILETRISYADGVDLKTPSAHIDPKSAVFATCGDRGLSSAQCAVSISPYEAQYRVLPVGVFGDATATWCAYLSPDDNNVACVQYWVVRVTYDSVATATKNGVVDVVLAAVATSIDASMKNANFIVRFRAPLPAPVGSGMVAAATAAAARSSTRDSSSLSVAVTSATTAGVQTFNTNSRDPFSVLALGSEDTLFCIRISASIDSATAIPMYIDSAFLVPCDIQTAAGRICPVVTNATQPYNVTGALVMVEDGLVTRDFEQNAGGSLKHADNGDSVLCYRPTMASNGVIQIVWTAGAVALATSVPVAREEIVLLKALDCTQTQIGCNNTVIVNLVIACPKGMIYDPEFDGCVEDHYIPAASYIAISFGVILSVILLTAMLSCAVAFVE